jgi:hypothetical protein
MVNAQAGVVAPVPAGMAVLTDVHGEEHTIPRRTADDISKDSKHNTHNLDVSFNRFVGILQNKNIPINERTMKKVGFGSRKYTAQTVYNSRTKERREPVPVQPEVVQNDVINDRALQVDGPASTAVLPPGAKVIAVMDENASENAKRQALKRNRAVFGEENVIETAEDCEDGTVVKGKKLKTSKGTTLTRDLCIEN